MTIEKLLAHYVSVMCDYGVSFTSHQCNQQSVTSSFFSEYSCYFKYLMSVINILRFYVLA